MNKSQPVKISSKDWEKYLNIRLAALSGSDARAFGASKEKLKSKTDEELKNRLDSDERFYYAIDEDGKFVSIGGAKEIASDTWMVVAVYTLEEYRRRGYSKKIMEAIEEELRRNGVQKMSLMVNVKQEPAVELYKKLGFAIVDFAKEQLMGDGNIYDEYLMEKDLN